MPSPRRAPSARRCLARRHVRCASAATCHRDCDGCLSLQRRDEERDADASGTRGRRVGAYHFRCAREMPMRKWRRPMRIYLSLDFILTGVVTPRPPTTTFVTYGSPARYFTGEFSPQRARPAGRLLRGWQCFLSIARRYFSAFEAEDCDLLLCCWHIYAVRPIGRTRVLVSADSRSARLSILVLYLFRWIFEPNAINFGCRRTR